MFDPKISLEFPILYDNQSVGTLVFLAEYTPHCMQEISYDTERKKSEVKDLKSKN